MRPPGPPARSGLWGEPFAHPAAAASPADTWVAAPARPSLASAPAASSRDALSPLPPVMPSRPARDALSPRPPTVHRFHVTVAPGTKLESGPATLHLCNDILVLARDIPPAVTGQWKLSDLRRYGAVPSGFIFEGGTRCGYCKYGCMGSLGSGSTPVSPRELLALGRLTPRAGRPAGISRTHQQVDGVSPRSMSEVLCPQEPQCGVPSMGPQLPLLFLTAGREYGDGRRGPRPQSLRAAHIQIS